MLPLTQSPGKTTAKANTKKAKNLLRVFSTFLGLFWLCFVLNFEIAAQKLRSPFCLGQMWVIKTNLAFEMANVVDFDIKSLDFVWVATPETYFVFFLGLQNR